MEFPIVQYSQGTTFYRGNKNVGGCDSRPTPTFFTKVYGDARKYATPGGCLATHQLIQPINILKLSSYYEGENHIDIGKRTSLIGYLDTLAARAKANLHQAQNQAQVAQASIDFSYPSLLKKLLTIFFGMTDNILEVKNAIKELILIFVVFKQGQHSLREFIETHRDLNYNTTPEAIQAYSTYTMIFQNAIRALLRDPYNRHLLPIETTIRVLIGLLRELRKDYQPGYDIDRMSHAEGAVVGIGINPYGTFTRDSMDLPRSPLLPSRISIRQFDKLIATLIPLVFRGINGFEYNRPLGYDQHAGIRKGAVRLSGTYTLSDYVPKYACHIDRNTDVPSEVCIYQSNAVLRRIEVGGPHGGGSLKDVYYTKYKKYKARCRRLDKTQNT